MELDHILQAVIKVVEMQPLVHGENSQHMLVLYDEQ